MRLGYRIKANSLLVGPGPVGGMPSLGVFLRDPNPYLREIWRKTRKTPNGQADKRDRELNHAPALPVLSAELLGLW